MLCDPGVGADATPERALRTEAYFLVLADHVTPRDAEMRDSDWLPTQNIILSSLAFSGVGDGPSRIIETRF